MIEWFACRRERHGVMNTHLYKSLTLASNHSREYHLPVFTGSLIIHAFRLQMWSHFFFILHCKVENLKKKLMNYFHIKSPWYFPVEIVMLFFDFIYSCAENEATVLSHRTKSNWRVFCFAFFWVCFKDNDYVEDGYKLQNMSPPFTRNSKNDLEKQVYSP